MQGWQDIVLPRLQQIFKLQPTGRFGAQRNTSRLLFISFNIGNFNQRRLQGLPLKMTCRFT
jgi:hypothetical protein